MSIKSFYISTGGLIKKPYIYYTQSLSGNIETGGTWTNYGITKDSNNAQLVGSAIVTSNGINTTSGITSYATCGRIDMTSWEGLTFTCWAYVTSFNNYARTMAGANWFHLVRNYVNRRALQSYIILSDNTYNYGQCYQVYPGIWYHIGMTWDRVSGSLEIWKDGEPALDGLGRGYGSQITSTEYMSGDDGYEIMIARRPEALYGQEIFRGYMDEMRVYDFAQSQKEIQTDMEINARK